MSQTAAVNGEDVTKPGAHERSRAHPVNNADVWTPERDLAAWENLGRPKMPTRKISDAPREIAPPPQVVVAAKPPPPPSNPIPPTRLEQKSALHQRIAELLEKIEERDAEIAWLKEQLCPLVFWPPGFGLTTQEGKVLSALYAVEGVASRSRIHLAMTGTGADEPSHDKIVDVFICKVRAKLQPHDIHIETQWGEGWYLTGENRAKLKAALDEVSA